MLLGTLASCAQTTDTDSGETIAETNAATNTESDTASAETETALRDELPDDLNFGGDEIVFVSNYREGWTSGEIAVEKITGDEINDAVYERTGTWRNVSVSHSKTYPSKKQMPIPTSAKWSP